MKRDVRIPSADVRGECGDSLLKLALLELYAEEANCIETVADTCLVQTDKESIMMNKRIRIRGILEGMYHAVPRAVGITAALILISGVFVTGALAISKTARDYLRNYILSFEGGEVQLVASGNGNGADVPGIFSGDVLVKIPEEWKGDYYPSFIPDGFELLGLSGDDTSQYVVYSNDRGVSFDFEESENAIRFLVDTSELDTETVDIGGNAIERISNSDKAIYLWSYGEKALCLRYDGDDDFALEIIRSVVKIK